MKNIQFESSFLVDTNKCVNTSDLMTDLFDTNTAKCYESRMNKFGKNF